MTEKILILRFSDFHGVKTIDEHKKVIEECNYCWWAKLGKQPSKTYLDDYFGQDKKIAYLYTANHLYKAVLMDVCYEKPTSNYPAYYEFDVFKDENKDICFFKLSEINEVDMSELDAYIVCSSGKEVFLTLKKTISSYMFIQDRNIPILEKTKRVPKQPKQAIKPKHIVNGCVYRDEKNRCRCKGFVNYGYECDRPNRCARQKI